MNKSAIYGTIFIATILSSCRSSSLESKVIGTWTRHEESKDQRFVRDVTGEIKSDHTFTFIVDSKLDSKKHSKIQHGTWALSGNELVIYSEQPTDPKTPDLHFTIISTNKTELVISTKGNTDIDMPPQTLTYTKVK